ncbi:hypothetical protein ES703_119750 [subsurface metagenome]
MSKIRLAKVEESIARKVSQRIRKEISRKEKVFDLADAIKHKQANCLGCSQLFYLLGNCVGLAVQVIHVEELKAGHMASIVGLPDATTMMVDLTFGRIMSKPFKFEKEFSKVGHYWELKNKNNPLGIHRRIQRWNNNELIAAIYNSRGVHYKMLREYHKAIYAYNKAIELNPKYAEACYNRGIAYYILGKYKEAKKDLLTSVKLDPALKADVKEIYMKLFEFPLVDFKLDTSAGSRNK